MRGRSAISGRPHAVAVIVAALLAATAGAAAWGVRLGGAVEDTTVSWRFQLRGAEPPNDVAIVGIDDATFNDLHQRWPFPRTLHARVLDRLRKLGARSVVYDVQFTEHTTEAADWALYDAVGRFPGTVLATTETDGHGQMYVLGGDQRLAEVGARAAMATFPTIAGGGIAQMEPSRGGAPTIAVAAADAVGHDIDRSRFDDGRAWIDFRGPPGTIPTVSFSDVLARRPAARALRGKIVVVGMTAPTLQDVHPTPTAGDDLMAGPEVQANAIWTVLHNMPLRDAPAWASLLAVLLLAVAPALAGLRLRALVVLTAPVVGGIYAVVCQVAFDAGWVLPVVGPMLGLALGTIGTVAAGYVNERRERRRVTLHAEVLEQAVRERTAELHETQLEVVRRLARAAEWRDEDTGEHIERIGVLSEHLGRAAGMSRADAETLRHAAVLHDIGKIGVPDRVLQKPARLDDEEWVVMREHAAIGASMLAGSNSPLVQMAEVIARTHHERWDGTGYPAGLKGAEIPLVGRICALCDVFDALLSRRPYKEPWPLDRAIEELRRQRGRHFDPDLTDKFLEIAAGLAGELHAGQARRDPPDDQQLRLVA